MSRLIEEKAQNVCVEIYMTTHVSMLSVCGDAVNKAWLLGQEIYNKPYEQKLNKNTATNPTAPR